MSQYGIAVTNKYDLFLDEDKDPLDVINELSAVSKEDKTAKKKDKKMQKKEAVSNAPALASTGSKPPSKPPTASAKLTTVIAETKQEFVAKDREDKENKPSQTQGQRGFPPRRGGKPFQPSGGEDIASPKERSQRTDRGDNSVRRTGGGNQGHVENADLPPRFANNESGKFGDRFGEGRGRGGFRGGRGGAMRGGRGRGSYGNNQNTFDQVPSAENFTVGQFGDEEAGFQAPETGYWNGGPDQQQRGGFDADKGIGTFGEEEGERGALGNRGGSRTFYPQGRGMRRGPRRVGGNFGGYGGRGRQYDRHSGSDQTGVKPTDKREGGGKANWGTVGDELAGENEGLNTTVSDDTGAEGEQTERATAKEVEEVLEKEQEPEQRELTLDEWKAMQAQEQRNKPAFNIRKPGEGEDPTLWKKLTPLAREVVKDKKKELVEASKDEEDDERHGKKQVLNIDIKFADESPRGFRGGRGGRGFADNRGGGGPMNRGFDRGGGRGGQRGARGGRRGDAGYRLDNESFPELSSVSA